VLAQVSEPDLPSITVRHQKSEHRYHQYDRSALPQDLQCRHDDIGTYRKHGDGLKRKVRQRRRERRNVDSRKWSNRHLVSLLPPRADDCANYNAQPEDVASGRGNGTVQECKKSKQLENVIVKL
jgi:hypothetical protein